jgi:mannose-6-phosphate isomerase-like protein (cupin superfamily)
VAKSGEVLENPVTGERIVWRRTAKETGGEALEYEMSFRPRGFVAQQHVHPRQSERHEVLSGSLGLAFESGEQILNAGEVVDVPSGAPHRLFPVGDGEVHAAFELRPALRSEVLIETYAGLAREGKVNERGYPHPLQLAVFVREFEPEGYATRPAVAVQRVVFGLLSEIGRRRGYRPWYPQYSDPEVARTPVERAGTGPGYVFLDQWDVEAPPEPVFEALADARTYPQWWQPVHIDAEAGGPPQVGRRSRQHFKGRLPYELNTESTVVALDTPRRIEVEVTGDLSGHGVWTLTPKNGRTHVRFDWQVNADRPLLRLLTPVLRPAFRWNHNWAIARAIEGLEPYARARASSEVGDTPSPTEGAGQG